MGTPQSFSESVIAAYRGWYQLVEREEGWEKAKFVLINDLSKSEVKPSHFNSTSDVRRSLDRLRQLAPDKKSSDRLDQSIYFLEQPPDQVATKDDVLRRGIPWRQINDDQLSKLHADFEETRRQVLDAGLVSESDLVSRYSSRRPPPGIANEIAAAGKDDLNLFHARLQCLAPTPFKYKEVISALPWINLVTFEENEVTVVVNQGELSNLGEIPQSVLALHEVGGHVLHFSQLLQSKVRIETAPHFLCLSAHTYDSYFIEGIAQFLTSVFVRHILPGPTILHMDVKRIEMWFAIRHKNLMDIIEGTIGPAEAAELERSYMGGDAARLRLVYEGLMRNAFFCCQVLSYYPSHAALLPALGLKDEALTKFLTELLSRHYSPQELDTLVAKAPA